MDIANLDPVLRHGAGTMVSRLESMFETIMDDLLRNEELQINLVSTSTRRRDPVHVR